MLPIKCKELHYLSFCYSRTQCSVKIFFLFSPSCNSTNRNSLSIHLDQDMKFSKNGTWKNFKNTNQDYGLYHEKGSLAKYSENSEKPLLIDSYDKLVLMASIDGKCESTLNVRLFEKENLQKYLDSYLAKLPKSMECGTTVFVNCTKILSKGKYTIFFCNSCFKRG